MENEIWSKERIMTTVHKILAALREKNSLKLRQKDPELLLRSIQQRFEEFDKRHQALTRKIVFEADGFNLEKLEMFVDMCEKVRTGQVTNEAMSVRVGQMEFDKYVKPAINKSQPN